MLKILKHVSCQLYKCRTAIFHGYVITMLMIANFKTFNWDVRLIMIDSLNYVIKLNVMNEFRICSTKNKLVNIFIAIEHSP